jgi:PadR family transcriptional regulator PadR
MRDQRSALLDVLPDASRPSGSLSARALQPIVDRPLSARLPNRGRQPGPVLVGQAGAPATSGPANAATSYAGGSGSFFRACILLLLREQPAHGYDILERLARFGFDSGDSGWLYRTLRAYEREAVLESTWQISASGPPRRVYSLTADGLQLLDAWAGSLRSSKRGIDEFLERHGRAVSQRPSGG